MSEATRERARLSDLRSFHLPIRARYDAAQTTDENRNHWGNADGLAAMAGLDPGTRATLRNRARYEVANNSYASGIVRTLASDTIGTGPSLQMASGDDAADTAVEFSIWRWLEQIRIAPKLRSMRQAKCRDGEAMGVLVDNPAIAGPVKLDLRLFEADQFAAAANAAVPVLATDGIILDDFGNVIGYTLLKQHPGDLLGGSPDEATTVPARDVIHWFTPERPGQYRGVPELTPALPLFAQLRRYTLAVIAAAETAADIAAFMKSVGPTVDPDQIEPLDTIDIEKRMLMTLPQGWDIGQLKAEQPTTVYDNFVRALLREIARCLSVPFNVAAGDSSTYNYASGRLDHKTYFKAIRVERADCEATVLEPLFRRWWSIARYADPMFPESLRSVPEPPSHSWRWDGDEHVDPLKEANAQAVRLASRTTTLADEYGRNGKDWEEQLRQIAKEQAFMKELGLVVESPAINEQDDENE